MNPRLKKLQDEKAAEVVEKKVRKKRAKKVEVIIPPEKHEHLIQLNTSATPKYLQHHYMSKAARWKSRWAIRTLVFDIARGENHED